MRSRVWKFIHNALVHGLLMPWPWEPEWISKLHDWTGRKQEMAEQHNDSLDVFKPGFDGNDTLPGAKCVCGDTFAEHEKPNAPISWDVCSFPCTKCECTEFDEREVKGGS